MGMRWVDFRCLRLVPTVVAWIAVEEFLELVGPVAFLEESSVRSALAATAEDYPDLAAVVVADPVVAVVAGLAAAVAAAGGEPSSGHSWHH